MRAHISALVLSIVIAGCSSGSSTPQTGATPAPTGTRPARRQANLITEEELAQSSARNGLQAVQMLRPDWLRGRGSASIRDVSPAAVIVYVNDQRLGGVNELEQLNVTAIKSLRFMSASEATNRYGTGHTGGVITVVAR